LSPESKSGGKLKNHQIMPETQGDKYLNLDRYSQGSGGEEEGGDEIKES